MANKIESIVFIDASIETPMQLAAGVALDAKVLILSPAEDGVEQITQAIATHSDISEIYIVSHGSPGEIRLGNAQLGLKTLSFYADSLSQWAATKLLKNLYLYGCNVAAGDAGAEFLAKLRSLTQANIAASTQLVGAANQGGTWELDTAIGAVPHRDLLTAGAIAAYPGILNADDFANATDLNLDASGSATGTGNNAAATHETGEPIHDPNTALLPPNFQRDLNDSIWWRWTPNESGVINVNTKGSDIDTVLAVYTGGPTVDNLTLLTRNDNADGQSTSSVTFNASKDITYYFAVDGKSNAAGDITINLDTPPEIDSGQLFAIAEPTPGGTADGTVVGTINVTADVTSLEITGGNLNTDGDGQGAFEIVEDGGVYELQVLDADELDFEGGNNFFTLDLKATDTNGFTDTESIFIEVTDQNEAPEIVNVNAPSSANEGTRITLTGQIFDPDIGDDLTIEIDWGDSSSTTITGSDLDEVVGSPGNFSFAPRHIYTDNDTYTIGVTVTDADGEVATETLAPITISNVAPTITQGESKIFNINEGSEVTFLLSATDPSADDELTWSIASAAAAGNDIDFTAASPNVNQPNQLFTYTPEENFNGTDTFQIQVKDDDGGIDIIDVTVNVAAVPDAPANLQLTTSAATIAEGDTLSLNGSFVDPDVGDTFTVNINWGDGSDPTVLSSADLTFNAATNTYSFNSDHVYQDNQVANILVTVTDSFGAVANASRSVTITNEPPAIVGDTVLSIDEDTTGSIILTADDAADTDFTWTISSQGANGEAEVTTGVGGTQEIAYTPDLNFNGLDEFTVELSDGDATTTATIVVGVNPVNDAPTNLNIGNIAPVNEGETVTLSGNFQDVDNSTNTDLDDVHSITVDWGDGTVETFQEGDLDGGGNPIFTDTGTVTVNFAGLTHEYEDEGDGTFDVTVTVTDAEGASVTSTETIQVNNVDPEIVEPGTENPIAGPINKTIDEDTSIDLTVEAIDAGTLDTLTWTLVDPPNNGTIAFDPVVESGVQTFTYTPNLNYVSNGTPDTFILEVTDGDGGIDRITYEITVDEVNDAPDIIVNNFDIKEGEVLPVGLNVLDALDTDDANDKITFTISGANFDSFQGDGVEYQDAGGNSVTVDVATKAVFTRQDIINGDVSFFYDEQVTPAFSIKVEDDDGLFDQVVGKVDFETVNDVPILNPLGTFEVVEGTSQIIDNGIISATDEETTNPALLVFEVSEVEGGNFEVFNPDTGVFETTNQFTQGQINAGQVRFKNNDTEVAPRYLITVSDGVNTTDPVEGTGTVDRINDAPTIDVVNFVVTEGVALPVDLDVLDASDTETTNNVDIVFTITGDDFLSFQGDGVEYQDAAGNPVAAELATKAVFDRQDIIDGDVSFLYEGEVPPTFTITVSDSDPDDEATVTQTVVVSEEDFTPVNDAPELVLDADISTSFEIGENDPLTVTDALISATDADIADEADLLFSVFDVEGGDFLIDEAIVTTFTLGQIQAGEITFVENGTAEDPSFFISVSDGEATTDPVFVAGNFDITTLVNDDPVITQNSFDIVENEPLVIDETVLDAFDEETRDNNLITFTLENTPGFDDFKLEVGGVIKNQDTGDELTFTLAEVLNDEVILTYTGEARPSFDIEVNDNNADVSGPQIGTPIEDGTQTVPAIVSFEAQNDPPTFIGNLDPFEVTEGQRETLTTDNIDATDPDDSDGSLRFNIVSEVEGGNFVVRGVTNSTSFTLQELAQGFVAFQHDGGESDVSYEITVSDGEITSGPIELFGDRLEVNDPPELSVGTFVVTEGESFPITLDLIDATDEESTSNQDLEFTITSPGNLKDFLSFQGNAVKVIDAAGNEVDADDPDAEAVVFNRQDIIDGEVTFLYDGETPPSFTIEVEDGEGGTDSASVTVSEDNFTAVNDAPVIELSDTFVVGENEIAVVREDKISASDADSEDDELLFEVSNVEGGEFLVNGQVSTTFTLAQIDNNSVRFRNDGTQIDPSFLITVTDGDITTDAVQVVGEVDPIVNDLPEITKNNFNIVENQPLLIDDQVLDAFDEETLNDSLIEFTLTSTPDPADFVLKVGNTILDPAGGLTFTLAQVLNGQVTLTYTGETTPSFQIEVSDNNATGPQVPDENGNIFNGITGPIAAEVEFTAQNDVPTFANGLVPFEVDESGRVTVTTANIDATDADDAINSLRFEVSDVQGGEFIVGGVADDTFTRLQLIQGLVRFRHDGESPDISYAITVNDGEVTSEPLELTGTVDQVNDAPTIKTNSFEVTEGVPLLVDTDVLNAADEETQDSSLIEFEIVPTGNPGDVFPTDAFVVEGIGTTTTFTLQEVESGLVTFTYEGEEPPSFAIEVSDGNDALPEPIGDGNEATTTVTANVVFDAVNDAPTLAIEFPVMAIAEGGTFTVGTDAATSDVVITGADEETTDPANLVYTVVSDRSVSFQLDGENTDTFTQAQLEAGQVTFVHDGSETPLTASLTVTLSDSDPDGAETTEETVTVNIAPENDPPQLLFNQLSIDEGETVTIKTGNLNASDVETPSLNLTFEIDGIVNGFFTVDDGVTVETFGTNQTNNFGDFTLEQVIQEQVTFTHVDDNESPTNPDAQLPSYNVEVKDGDGATATEPAGTEADIDFTPLNDAPELQELTFTIAEDGVQLITSANINAIDPDALPTDLQYTVSNVTGGFFARVAGGETTETDTFTQADINAPSNIVFVHDGSNTAPSYTLKVEDELGASDTANFTATLNAVNDAPTIVTNTITLIEGEEVTLTIDDLRAKDEESGPSNLTFTPTAVSGGDFFLNGNLVQEGGAIATFTQQNVLDEVVTFKHDGSNDAPSYTLTVEDGGINGDDTTAESSDESTVVPDFTPVNDPPFIDPIDIPPFTFNIAQGGSRLLDEDLFLVQDEESVNKELIVYNVTEVENGDFLLLNTVTDQFTQQDIEAGRVSFRHDGSELPPSYMLTVSDSGVPEPESITITRVLDGDLFTNANDAPTLDKNSLTVAEGGTVRLSTSNLNASDNETARLNLTFEISDIANGTFTVKNEDGTIADVFGEVSSDADPVPATSTDGSFELADVVEGRVFFTHDGFDFAPSYKVAVTDEAIGPNPNQDAETSESEAATIAFTRENDDPELISQADFAFTINEGQTRVVPLTAIDATDEPGETSQSELQFSVSDVAGGFFADSDNFDPDDPTTAITEFSREDIASGGVVFVHDGKDTPPTYTLKVVDGEGGQAIDTYVGTLSKVNDEPSWTVNQLTLIENDQGDKTLLDSSNLFAIDEESDAAELRYTLEAVDGGTFFKGNDEILVDGNFTQQDVLDGLISFVQDTDNNNDAPSYELSLTDSGITDENGDVIAGTPITITASEDPIAIGDVDFTAVNDVPIPDDGTGTPPENFVFNVPTINEGATVALSNDPAALNTIVINTLDEETTAANLIYEVTAIANADFKLAATGEVVNSFNQSQVNSGAITFVHDGSELMPSFTLTLTDQAVGDDPANVLTQTVVPNFKLDNDAPTFTANQLAPIEGQLITLTSANLAASDREDAATQLLFSIDPATVEDADTPDGEADIDGNKFFLNGVELTAADTFTIVDINAERLTFQDDGDELAPTYKVTVTDTDGASVTETATIDLTNFQVNDDPEITKNSFVFEEGEFFTLTKTDNLLTVDDETTDPAQLVYTIVDPVGVTFLRNGNEETLTFTQQEINVGAIAFQHDDETTAPSFTITVEDPDGGITTVPAGVDYQDINDPPVAVDDAGEGFTTTQSTVLLTPSLVANDIDEEGATLFVASINGGNATLASGATVTLNGNAVSYNPNGAFTDLGAGETATDTFEYTVSDGGETATGTVTIVIEGVNDPPMAADDDFTGTPVAENTVSVFNVLGNDGPDPDGDTLTISKVDATGATGQVTTDGSTITYDASTVQGLAAGDTLVETFTYEISDGNGGTDTATVKVSVLGVEDAPVAVADSGEGFITPDDFQPFTTAPLTDNDLEDDGDPLTITKLNDAAAATGDIITLDSGGTLLLNADNSVTYTPPAAFEALAAGATQDEVFTYTITDGTSESTATATITVTGTNTPPVAVDNLDPGFATDEDTPVTLTVLDNDVDNDGDALTISAVDLAGVQGAVTNNGTTLTYTPPTTFNALSAGEVVEETLTYTVSDGNGGTDTASVKVTVTGVNDLPVAVDDSGTGFATDEDTAITLPNVLSNDTDPDGDTLTISSINTSQTRGTVTNNNGVLTYDPNGAFDLLGEGVVAQDTFTYTVSDGNGGTDTATVTVNITGLVEIPNSFFDLERLLRYNNPNSLIPGDQIDSLPLVQLYDENFYLSQNRDVAVAIGAGRLSSGYQHFVSDGIAEGRNPSILFNEEFYLANNEDVRNAVAANDFASGLQHFLLFGHEELNRNPSAFFNQRAYLANNQDIVTAINAGDFQSPFEHYIEAGSDENRVPALALYNEGFYLANNPDIRNAVVNGTFNSGFEHFVSFGQREGRNPSSLYDEDSYLALNPDVGRAVASGDFISGFQHYEQIGRFEGRPVF